MQLTEVFCYALLSITISSVCVQAERKHELEDRKFDKRLRKRATTVLVESFPTEKIYQKPKVIYRRLSKHRYAPPKPKHGPPRPIRTYGPPKSTRSPGKKYNGKLHTKHEYSRHKGVTNKPRYGPPKPNRIAKPKRNYGPPKKRNPIRGVHKHQEPTGFGEPPNYENEYGQTPEFDDYQKPTISSYPSSNQGYAEPPVDSYGVPIESNLHDLAIPMSHNIGDPTIIDEFTSDFDNWKNFEKENDNRVAYAKKKPIFANADPEGDVYVTPVPEDEIEEQNLNSYSEIYNYRQNKEKNKKKKPYYVNNVKIMNQPWKGKFSSKIEDEIIVGGQYAEPPARYIPKFQSGDTVSNDDTDYDFGNNENHDPEIVSSATNSPYVNYKHSNVAFSPQNLNDAFSIVN